MVDHLNVVFHGTFGFINWGTSLEVLVPDVQTHVYKAGTWTKEIDLEEGTTYNLTGVTPGDAMPQLECLGIAVVRNKRRIKRDANLVFCSLVLPAPDKFVARQCMVRSDEKEIFQGSDATHPTLALKSYARTHVLVYSCLDSREVQLRGLDWMPERDSDGFVNLHIFAEPEYSEMHMTSAAHMAGNAHMLQSFRELMHLFRARVIISPIGEKRFLPQDDCPGSAAVDGLPAEQEISLIDRHPPVSGGGVNPANCASGGADNGN
jgi:hypothetical protein